MKTVKVSVRGLYHNAKPFCGKIRFKLSCCSAVGNSIIVPKEWDEYPFETNSEIVEINLIPNSLTGEGSFYYYEIEYCKNTGAYIYDKYGKRKAILSGVCVVPDYDCNFIDIATIEAPQADPVDLSKAYASEAKEAVTRAMDGANTAESCALRAEQILEEMANTEAGGHFLDYNNPHKVTAEQVGAADAVVVNAAIEGIRQEVGTFSEAIENNATAISKNAQSITNLQTALNEHKESAITQADINKAIAPVSEQVAKNHDNITALQEADKTINNALSNKADATALEATNQAVAKNALDISANTNKIQTNQEALAQLTPKVNSHINNTNNPHGVTAEHLTKKSESAGRCDVRWGASDYYKQGEVIFHFDPAMYRRGYGYAEIRMPDYMTVDGVDIGGVTVDYYGDFVFAEQGNPSGWVFRSAETENVNGLELYIFISISIPDLLKKDTSYAVWVGVGTTQNCADYAHSAEIVTAGFDSGSSYSAITYNYYEQSGVYRVLTEEQLRDKKTGLPYTLAVEDGQLRLVRYTENEF